MGSVFNLVLSLLNLTGNAFSSDIQLGSANSGSNIGGSIFGSTGTPPV
ncbi:hypothetical protein ACFTSD_05040 [Nocardiaceae bacterium NPDC056970]